MTISEARNKIGISQKEFASGLELSRPTIARYEADIYQPPPSFKYHVAYKYKLKLKDLKF